MALDDNVIPLVDEMLGEVMKLQVGSKDVKNVRERRRLVMELRQVAREIRLQKVKQSR